MMLRSDSPSAITSLGLVTCIGDDVVTSSAAQRAGLSRRSQLADFPVFDPVELEAPLTVAPVPGLSGFIQTGAWIALAEAAISNLIKYGDLPSPKADPRFWQGTAVAWVVPEIEFERFGWPEHQLPQLLDRWAGQALLDVISLPVRRVPAFFASGAVGLAQVILGLTQLQARESERILVLATDSWLDRLSLAWLNGQQRLKTPDSPVGLCPGQAAACALIEVPEAAQRRKAHWQGSILGAAVQPVPIKPTGDQEISDAQTSSVPRLGAALAQALRDAVASAGLALPFRGDIYVDLNGEPWRAQSWGVAQTHLGATVDWSRSRLCAPAIQTGDIGAASGLAALCFAVRSYVRGYARGTESIVCSLTDNGTIGSIVLGTPR